MEKDRRILYFTIAVLSAMTLFAYCGRAEAQQAAAAPQLLGNAVANQPVHSDVSRPVSELALAAPVSPSASLTHAPLPTKLRSLSPAQTNQTASAAQNPAAGSPVGAKVGLSFEGVGNTADLNCPSVAGFEVAPPDTNAAVGDTEVVQWVNVCYSVFDKSTGKLLAGPFAGTNFWAGFGAPCETNNDGDIVIQWDKKNHRWLASQNVFNGPPFFTCVAVSQTADATGGYFRYAFPQPGFPDYPKWGLKSNVYYQTQNDFGNDGFDGVNLCAYQADLMRQGDPKAMQICILDNSNGTLFDDSMLPADDDSPGAPNSPEVLLGSIDNFLPGDNHVYEYVFSADFNNPKNSTLAGVQGSMPISVPAFNLAICASGGFLTTNCVPQPGVNAPLDTLGDRLMYRLAHFNDSASGTQHFLVTHNVNNSTAVGARWYEFRVQGLGATSLSLYQSGDTPDDGEYRWMGSAAMDKSGDIALGYSRSSAAAGDFPSIYYAGQTAGDPPGTTDAEALIKQGAGSQLDTGGRWGDYSSMALDGADSCTFWYTTEYYPATGAFSWATWLASLKFPNCR